jgi:hypothetical protein
MIKLILFSIAKIIDNDYIGKEDTFEYYRYAGYYWLSSGQCDDSSFVRVYSDIDFCKIIKIEILGRSTDGWQDIQYETFKIVEEYMESIKGVIS